MQVPLTVTSSTPASDGYSEQECDEQTRQRRFAGYSAKLSERLSWALRPIGRGAQSVDRKPKALGNLLDFSRYVGCRIDGALRDARGRDRVRWLYAHLPRPSVRGNEAATFGYPRVRVF
jgi:hypothetical protein